MEQNLYSHHKPLCCQFPRNKVIPIGFNTDWQIDLMDMGRFLARINNNWRFVLVIINVLSKYCWAIPICSKHPEDVVKAFTKVLTSSGREPW